MKSHLAILILLVLSIVVGGTVFFHIVESWSWIDAYFFTVVTITTVGYGSLVPATALGKIGTTVLIFLGISVIALAINFFGSELVTARVKSIAQIRKDRREAANGFTEN